jgi:hypothetical protein
MAAVNVTIVGNLTKMGTGSSNDANGPVMIIGQATLTGLEVGGGPMQPGGIFPSHPIAPGGGPHPGHPIDPGGIFPSHPGPILPPVPGGGKPTFPIWGPPGINLPPGAGYPPVAGHPLPPGESKPEPIIGWEAQVIWSAETGWAVIVVPKEGTEVPTPSRRKS